MTNLTDVDRDAMSRAIETVRNESRARRRQVDSMLSSRPFERVGRFASFYCQMDALHLDPWETPPCWIDNIDVALITPNDARHIPGSARLLRRLIDGGLSRYEPDPLGALARVEQRQ
ncbi:hypothetical protein AB4Z51_03290 [Bradyrhizobium sp. 2TAF36]|uniref:hypothetical protein n=1 Tax=Bradyrhizobium sp. 2TAF36 TaxID=3233016 RepID=UPI003F91A9D3